MKKSFCHWKESYRFAICRLSDHTAFTSGDSGNNFLITTGTTLRESISNRRPIVRTQLERRSWCKRESTGIQTKPSMTRSTASKGLRSIEIRALSRVVILTHFINRRSQMKSHRAIFLEFYALGNFHTIRVPASNNGERRSRSIPGGKASESAVSIPAATLAQPKFLT